MNYSAKIFPNFNAFRVIRNLCATLFILIGNPILGWGQTSALQYWFDDSRSFYNPAIPDPDYVTHDGYYNLFVETHYAQESLAGIDGNLPGQAMLNVQWYPAKKNDPAFRWKFGGTIYRDQFGSSKFQFITGSLGVQWVSPHGDIFSGGFSAGYQQWRIKLAESDLLQFGDPLAQGVFQNGFPDMSLGLYLNKRVFRFHDLFFGLSLPHLFIPDQTQNNQDWILNKSVILLGGANIYLSDYGHLEPAIQINSNGQALFNLRNHFRKSFWLGLGYDFRGLANAEFGIRFKNIVSDPRIRKSQNNFWRLGFSYRFWQGDLPAEFGNLIGIRLAYAGHK